MDFVIERRNINNEQEIFELRGIIYKLKSGFLN
jgi:hypothetical protein